jgi:hypothetical protein
LDFQVRNGIIAWSLAVGRPGHFARGGVYTLAAGLAEVRRMDIAVMTAFAVLLAGGIWVLSGMLFRSGRPHGSHP